MLPVRGQGLTVQSRRLRLKLSLIFDPFGDLPLIGISTGIVAETIGPI
jgi:hypothetical protein